VDDLGDAGSMVVRFSDTDFQGMTFTLETANAFQYLPQDDDAQDGGERRMLRRGRHMKEDDKDKEEDIAVAASEEASEADATTEEATEETEAPTEGDDDFVPYYQKMEGVIDCVNDLTGDDNVVIITGTIQGTAKSEGAPDKYFEAGDRFVTAVVGNNQGDAVGSKDQIGEISNLGPQEDPDTSDCMYFKVSDFDLRDVASGHLTVSN